MNLPARVCYIAVTFHTSIGLNTLVDGDTLLYDIHSVIYVYWCLTGWYTIYNIVPYTWYTRRYKPVSIWYHTYTISHGIYKIYTRELNRLRGNGPINSITNAVFRPFSFCFEMYCGFLIFKTWTQQPKVVYTMQTSTFFLWFISWIRTFRLSQWTYSVRQTTSIFANSKVIYDDLPI